jgi:hypothetical protein
MDARLMAAESLASHKVFFTLVADKFYPLNYF